MSGNLIAMIVGAVFIILGLFLTNAWSENFLVVLKGCLGPAMAFVGLLAIVIGYSEHKATREFEAATAPSPPTVSEPVEAPTDEAAA